MLVSISLHGFGNAILQKNSRRQAGQHPRRRNVLSVRIPQGCSLAPDCSNGFVQEVFLSELALVRHAK